MLAILVAVGVLGLILLLAPRFTRRSSHDDVARFHRARYITNEWARQGVTRPVFTDGAQRAEPHERESEPAR